MLFCPNLEIGDYSFNNKDNTTELCTVECLLVTNRPQTLTYSGTFFSWSGSDLFAVTGCSSGLALTFWDTKPFNEGVGVYDISARDDRATFKAECTTEYGHDRADVQNLLLCVHPTDVFVLTSRASFRGAYRYAMILEVLFYCVILFVCISLLLVLYISFRIAKPPWHHPNPGKVLSEDNVPKSWAGATSPSQLGMTYIESSFLSYSNLTLRAWLIPSRLAFPVISHGSQTPEYHSSTSNSSSEGSVNASDCTPSQVAVVCVHGAGRDRRAFLRHSKFLSQAGYDVLLFDCGNHGTSDCVPMWPFSPWPGRAVSLGKREYQDVNAAVNYVLQRGAEKVVVLGTSQGASAALVAAAKHKNVTMLVLENPFVSPDALVSGIVDVVLARIGVPVVGRLLKTPIVWLSLLRTGNMHRYKQIRAVDFVGDLDVPMFFIHGTEDIIVNYKQSEELFYKVTHERKDIWIVNGANHTQCWFKEPEQFEARLLAFIREHIGEGKP